MRRLDNRRGDPSPTDRPGIGKELRDRAFDMRKVAESAGLEGQVDKFQQVRAAGHQTMIQTERSDPRVEGQVNIRAIIKQA